MKKVLSLVLALSVAASLLTGSFALSAEEAYDDTYVYVMSETSVTGNNVEITASAGGEYIGVITEGSDPWISLAGISVPSEYGYMAVKYAGASNTSFVGNNHYVATDGGLAWGQPGSFTAPNMTADNAWHLKIYSVADCFAGVGTDNITNIRLLIGNTTDAETRIAYVGFFKSEAEASAYDAAYCAANTLDDMPPPERTEVIPEALDAVPEYTFDFNDLEAGYDLYGVSYAEGNPFRVNWTPLAGNPTSSVVVADDHSAMLSQFSQAEFDDRWKGGSEISLDLKGTGGSNFCGFYVRPGDEGTTPFFENDGARSDGADSTTGTTGIGFSFRTKDGKQGIEIFVKYFDSTLNKLQVKGYFFADAVEATNEFHTYKIVDDDAGTIQFYADGSLFAQVKYANPEMTESAMYSEKYYSDAQILDAEGTVLVTVENALISTQSTLKLGVRAETLYIDNIRFTKLSDGSEPTYGNVDGNDRINGADVTLLLQYLAEWDVTINETYADVNGDGEIDGRDATLLLQYLANWDVVLGPQTTESFDGNP